MTDIQAATESIVAATSHPVSVQLINEPRQPGGCKLKTAPVRPVVAARPAEYVCSEDLFY
ncbi:hypothetical protein AD87_004450 [Salmonella enterica subsp. enterica serovar Anatum]|nr:hypothetical protein [Salmonella enterica subsp. enterica serovar Anatum]